MSRSGQGQPFELDGGLAFVTDPIAQTDQSGHGVEQPPSTRRQRCIDPPIDDLPDRRERRRWHASGQERIPLPRVGKMGYGHPPRFANSLIATRHRDVTQVGRPPKTAGTLPSGIHPPRSRRRFPGRYRRTRGRSPARRAGCRPCNWRHGHDDVARRAEESMGGGLGHSAWLRSPDAGRARRARARVQIIAHSAAPLGARHVRLRSTRGRRDDGTERRGIRGPGQKSLSTDHRVPGSAPDMAMAARSVRRVSSRPPQRQFDACNDPGHRIIATEMDRPVVGQEQVGDTGQPRQSRRRPRTRSVHRTHCRWS